MSDKEKRIHIRVTDEEQKQIKKNAAAANTTVTRFVKASCLKKDVLSTRANLEINRKLGKLLVEVRKIGNNINQATKIMNTYYADIEGEFDYVVKQLGEVQELVDNMIELHTSKAHKKE